MRRNVVILDECIAFMVGEICLGFVLIKEV